MRRGADANRRINDETLWKHWCISGAPWKSVRKQLLRRRKEKQERKVLQDQGRNFKERAVHRDIKKKKKL